MQTEPPRQLLLAADVAPAIHEAAVVEYPQEACGLLLGRRRSCGAVEVRRAVAVPNDAPLAERRHRYAIEPRLLLQWDRAAAAGGLSIVGFYHSHPDHPPRPSSTDAALAWPTYVYLIVALAGRPQAAALVSGMAAWTFDEASSSFRELSIEVDLGEHEIEYFI